MGSIVAAVAAVVAALTPPGVGSPAGGARYVAFPDGAQTVVAAIGTNSRTTRLPARFRFPVVARDGTREGLSFDGRTLVLEGERRGANTRFVVVDTRRLAARTLDLAGAFSFDALSPDGRLLYLIEYVSPDDPRLYRVRAYDLARGRLLDGAVADKRTGQTAMEGVAISRATSPDGRWAYTLYAGGPHPFVHALDTVRRQAVCLDVHGVGESRIWFARLAVSSDGSQLLLRSGGRTLTTLAVP